MFASQKWSRRSQPAKWSVSLFGNFLGSGTWPSGPLFVAQRSEGGQESDGLVLLKLPTSMDVQFDEAKGWTLSSQQVFALTPHQKRTHSF